MSLYTLQLKKEQGDVAVPIVTIYYHASVLNAMMQWWDTSNNLSWHNEQMDMTTLLSEWALTDVEFCSCMSNIQRYNMVSSAILTEWAKYQPVVSPGQSPTSSFIHNPKFIIAHIVQIFLNGNIKNLINSVIWVMKMVYFPLSKLFKT